MIDVAVDIGGTFTDVVGWDGRELHATKVPSTPHDLVEAVRTGVARILEISGYRASDVRRFVHGTTVATNAVLEEKGARIGLLMTKGFEDVLEIGRQKRSSMYDLLIEAETPVFLAPRRMRVGVTERIDSGGTIVIPLEEDEVDRQVARLREAYDIEGVAVCYLFAFRNPIHEQRTQAIIAASFPDLYVSLSSEVDPVFREYERACVTAFDAYVRPVVAAYLDRLVEALRCMGIPAKPQIMQSRGGIASIQGAITRPVTTLLSGPAAGVLGGKAVSADSHLRDVITLDMGGTSCDICLLRDGRLMTSREGRLRGFPLRVPMLDLTTIGAGGGSVAWVDEAGGLGVGPQSAGAQPGPACYGRGGIEPTVTDASLVLGYLNPRRAAGNLELDRHAAEEAVGKIATSLGMDLVAAAYGIHRVINAKMADGIRMVSVQKGYDPREFALVLLGGAGPIHGGALASVLAIDTLVVPERPGVLSAFGLLVADIEYDTYRTFARHAGEVEVQEMLSVLEELEGIGWAKLKRDGIPPDGVEVRRFADMRYVGQSYELEIPLAQDLRGETVALAVAAFHEYYLRVYGHASMEDDVEFVNLRTVHVAHVAKPRPVDRQRGRSLDRAFLGHRDAYFGDPSRFIETPVYERSVLPHLEDIDGPAIIEQDDTTVVLYPWQTCQVDDTGTMVVRVKSE
jgi:N-methylhydantoinase A